MIRVVVVDLLRRRRFTTADIQTSALSAISALRQREVCGQRSVFMARILDYLFVLLSRKLHWHSLGLGGRHDSSSEDLVNWAFASDIR